MLHYIDWNRPDPDGKLRRANEARAAEMYQGIRRIGRIARVAPGLIWRLAGAPLRLMQNWRLQTRTAPDRRRAAPSPARAGRAAPCLPRRDADRPGAPRAPAGQAALAGCEG